MSKLTGTVVADGLVPLGSNVTHYDTFGQQGWMSVATIAERDAINVEEGVIDADGISSGHRRVGMFVYVSSTDKVYQLRVSDIAKRSGLEVAEALGDNTNWVIAEMGGAADKPVLSRGVNGLRGYDSVNDAFTSEDYNFEFNNLYQNEFTGNRFLSDSTIIGNGAGISLANGGQLLITDSFSATGFGLTGDSADPSSLLFKEAVASFYGQSYIVQANLDSSQLHLFGSSVAYSPIGFGTIYLYDNANAYNLAVDVKLVDHRLSTLPTNVQNSMTPGSDTKAPTVDSVKTYIDAADTATNTRINTLVAGAPAALDTLKEIADQIAADESGVAAILSTQQSHTSQISSNTTIITGNTANISELRIKVDSNTNALATKVTTVTPSYASNVLTITTNIGSANVTIPNAPATTYVQNSLAASTVLAPSVTAVQTALDLKQVKPVYGNLGFGYMAGGATNTVGTGTQNTAIGTYAMYQNGSGYNNTAVGHYAGFQNTTAYEATYVGNGAGMYTTTGARNTYIGYNAGYNSSTAAKNTIMGAHAGEYQNGSENSYIGFAAGYGINGGSGSNNTSQGNRTLYSLSSGSRNTGIGNGAGNQITTGNSNVFLGIDNGLYTTTGTGNVFVGDTTGASNTTGNYNVALGDHAGPLTGALSNTVAIGRNAKTSTSNTMVIGGAGVDALNVGIGTQTPGSPLTVAGVIETTTGGIKFPDGTVQTTAGASGPSADVNKSYVDSADANLQSQITSNTNSITTNTNSISSNTSSITTNTNSITTNTNSINTLNTSVAGKADKTYVDSADANLQSQVTSNTNALATKVTTVTPSIAGQVLTITTNIGSATTTLPAAPVYTAGNGIDITNNVVTASGYTDLTANKAILVKADRTKVYYTGNGTATATPANSDDAVVKAFAAATTGDYVYITAPVNMPNAGYYDGILKVKGGSNVVLNGFGVQGIGRQDCISIVSSGSGDIIGGGATMYNPGSSSFYTNSTAIGNYRILDVTLKADGNGSGALIRSGNYFHRGSFDVRSNGGRYGLNMNNGSTYELVGDMIIGGYALGIYSYDTCFTKIRNGEIKLVSATAALGQLNASTTLEIEDCVIDLTARQTDGGFQMTASTVTLRLTDVTVVGGALVNAVTGSTIVLRGSTVLPAAYSVAYLQSQGAVVVDERITTPGPDVNKAYVDSADANLRSQITSNTSSITTNTNSITTNTNSINTLNTNVATNTSNITSNTNAITALQAVTSFDQYNVSSTLRTAVVQGSYDAYSEMTSTTGSLTGSVAGMRFSYQVYLYEYMPGTAGTLVWVRLAKM
ncbi:beta strand repeat-containing protein [Hymenobacter siberiensis]|uniref:beta strand repeat-containing protein n=1 Tax=Hymenobacter siberiensis TaxID=2848396 RepID=UPI001C1E317C|nr:hypothetical protein [Hymenobacter siberiensis]